MIRVYANRAGARCRLFVEGHADYRQGEDIVCAAVSALTGALVAFAAESPACRHLRRIVRKGELFLSCRGGLGVGFDIMMRGLRAISEQYPECLRIEVAQGC